MRIMPQASNNSEFRENAAYESILYFTHHKNITMQIGIMKEKYMHVIQLISYS